ncbi:Uncharacterised protein [Vibrio cholerae]|nr:Uncharacterised protein [Vibrio cholerae]
MKPSFLMALSICWVCSLSLITALSVSSNVMLLGSSPVVRSSFSK